MSVPPLPDLDTLSLDELKKLVVQLLVRVSALEEEIQQLRAETARLKDLPKKPKLAPGGMDKATEPDKRARTKEARRQRRKRQNGRRTPPVTEERTLVIEAPAGSRRRGFEPFTVQDLILTPQVILFRRERWVTPDGEEITAPLPPEVTGHFGPGIVRFVLMQHIQGQVTVERLLAQLKGLGVRISKGQIITLLTANKDTFHAEKDAMLEAGLASATWVTVDDTAARHAGHDEYTTHIGNDRFAWFATRPSKSRLNFLDLLRAGHPDYVINAAAVAYLVEHKVAEAVITSLLGNERRSFADDATWQAHLDSFGLGAGCRRRVTEAAMVGAIVARGRLTDTVIVSDDAGQFDVFQHALCWIHAERHLRRIVCVSDEQHRLVNVQRQLVWWFYADLKLYKDEPIAARRTALRRRFDRIFTRVTGFAELDEAVARTHANKNELLLVLDRPDIPLHTNGSENDVRSFVTKRRISGETRSAAGKQARDTFLSLLKTCSKLAVSFWDYLGARLKIPDADRVPWLPDLIRQNVPA
jgi:hypothetical protein